MNWHQTIIIGNLGADPEMRYLQDGNSVCSLNVAVNDSWHDRRTGERREQTTWYRVSAWRDLGERCNRHLSRGRQVMVIGRVSARAYTNRNGEPAASLDMHAFDVRFMGRRGEQEGGEGGGGGYSREDFAPPGHSPAGSGSQHKDEPDVYVPPGRAERDSEGPQYEDVDDIPF